MPKSLLVSVIIPAYNEEASIGDVILKIHDLELESCEVLVIDDGSTDKTAQVAKIAGATVISHPYNIGNGAAVKSGIRSAKGKALVFLDGDGQHDPREIPNLISKLSQYHMVVGARQRNSQTSKLRDIANWVYNRFASYVAKFQIQDLTSGMRAMRREDALRFCDMLPNTFSYPTTSTLAFLRSGRSLKYVPITTKYRIGKSKINPLVDGPRFLLIIMKIATLFAPLRVFLPVSIITFSMGVGWYLFTYFAFGRFTNMSALLCNTAVIIFMLGLIAEQIASLRLEKNEGLTSQEAAESYEVLKQFSPIEKSDSSHN